MARNKSFDDFLILTDFCLCQKRTMYLSVMFSLNYFTKQTIQGNVQCISCSLSFSFRGYDRSYSISCTLSFLTSKENNENGTIINKTFDRFDLGKAFGNVFSEKIA